MQPDNNIRIAQERAMAVFTHKPGVALAVTRFSKARKKQVDGGFLASVADYRRADGSYAIPGEFVTVIGVKQGV